jgi:hypothetical protein
VGRYDAETSLAGQGGSTGSQSMDSQAVDMGKGIEKGDTGSGMGSGEYQDAAPVAKSISDAAPGAAVEAGKYMGSMEAVKHLAAGKLDKLFYGHTLPEHFKKTNIISTSGRVR